MPYVQSAMTNSQSHDYLKAILFQSLMGPEARSHPWMNSVLEHSVLHTDPGLPDSVYSAAEAFQLIKRQYIPLQ